MIKWKGFKNWLLKVENIIEECRETWLIGDFNLDLRRRNANTYNRKQLAQLAQQELIGRGLVQLIEGTTHRKNGSESNIDLYFTNEPRKISSSGKISTGTDHDCIWALRESKYVQVKREFMKRSFRNFDKEVF